MKERDVKIKTTGNESNQKTDLNTQNHRWTHTASWSGAVCAHLVFTGGQPLHTHFLIPSGQLLGCQIPFNGCICTTSTSDGFQTQIHSISYNFSCRSLLYAHPIRVVWWLQTGACCLATNSSIKMGSGSFPPGRSLEAYFVLKLLASECFRVEIIKAKCVETKPGH